MPTTPEFNLLYKKLNNEQKQAVDTIDGPVMVIAGPGTGKTQILALRIANILLQTDTAPSSILALTFTESGVHQMRTRLVSIIGAPAYKINIFTFHSFCNEIIRQYPEEFPEILGAVPATDIDQIQIIEKALDEIKLELLKPYGDPTYYVRSILSTIRSLKREDVGPEEFKKLVHAQEKDFNGIEDLYHEKGAHKGKMKGAYADLKKKIEKNKELGLVYEQYELGLKNGKLFDFEDMIREVVKALRTNQDLLLQLQEKYQYILADEHQDANAAQNSLLELLSNFHDSPNIFIVGDEKQAIFRFQGASLDNFLYFKNLFPSATLISLKNNYRSTQLILDAAYSLILNNPVSDEKLKVELKAAGVKESNKPVSLYEFTNSNCEHQFIVQDIEKKIAGGVKASEIAIIYRENKDAQELIRTLEKSPVPFTVFSDQNILEDQDIRNFILLFRTINDYGNEELLAQCLYCNFLKLKPLDVFKLTYYARRNKIYIADIIKSPDLLKDAGVEDIEQIGFLAQKFDLWVSDAKNQTLVKTFELVAHQSGFLHYLLALPDSLEKMTKLDNLFTEAKKVAESKKDARLAELLHFIKAIGEYNILIKTGQVGTHKESIQLMTAHKSKGLEFGHVYIVGVSDGHWGNKRQINQFHIPLKGITAGEFDPMEDERRLFYVALTRAKEHITITYSTSKAGKSGVLPSQFISEINPVLIETVSTAEIEKEINCKPEAQYAPTINSGLPISDKEYIQKLFLEQGWSVTALNNYLSCPWKYFFSNLIRIPSGETKHQLYGIAIHSTLKEYFNKYAKKEGMSIDATLALFEKNLSKLPFHTLDYEPSLQKGKDALTGYFKTYGNSWPHDLLTEFSIYGINLELEKNGQKFNVPIRGVLDKIEFLTPHEVNVVDYKTREPLSRNELMGLTKNGTGDYFRQLIFYKLLLNNFDNRKYKMVSAEIDFIEPDASDRYKKEKFEIGDEDVEKLLETIADASYDIYSGEFWTKKCEEKDCEYCHLRKMIDSN